MPGVERGRGRPVVVAALVAVVVAVGAVGCGGDEEPTGPLETVDVQAPPELDLSNDPRAPERAPSLSGVLPEDFPSDLPLHLPASLVDFGDVPGGRSVSLITRDGLGVTLGALETQARRRGWEVSIAAGGRRLVRGERTVLLTVEDADPGTVYRYVY